MKLKLCELENTLKNFLFVYLLVITFGLIIGLVHLGYTTAYSPQGAVDHWNGSGIEEDNGFDIPESYPKPISEMLVTTHNHILGFGFILFTLGIIFYFNSIISGFWLKFLLIEPLLSIVITFSSIWAVRFVDKSFIWLTVASAVLLYSSFFIMAGVSLYELKIKKPNKQIKN